MRFLVFLIEGAIIFAGKFIFNDNDIAFAAIVASVIIFHGLYTIASQIEESRKVFHFYFHYKKEKPDVELENTRVEPYNEEDDDCDFDDQ